MFIDFLKCMFNLFIEVDKEIIVIKFWNTNKKSNRESSSFNLSFE